jgi:hypothetical protein
MQNSRLQKVQPLLHSVSISKELGDKFLLTLFRAKLIVKPTMPNQAKLATALCACCMHGQPQESDLCLAQLVLLDQAFDPVLTQTMSCRGSSDTIASVN